MLASLGVRPWEPLASVDLPLPPWPSLGQHKPPLRPSAPRGGSGGASTYCACGLLGSPVPKSPRETPQPDSYQPQHGWPHELRSAGFEVRNHRSDCKVSAALGSRTRQEFRCHTGQSICFGREPGSLMPTSVPAALPPSAHMPFLPPQRPRLPPEDVQVGAAGEQAGRLAAGSGERPPGLCEQPSGSARDWEADRDTGLSGFGAFFFF